MEDVIILRAGYNQAINDIVTIINEMNISEDDKNLIRDRISRKQRQYLIGNTKYEGSLYKYYDKQSNIGYILFDDIYELKGVAIFIEEGTYKELDGKELIYARNQYELIRSEFFSNKDLINLRYKELLDKWKPI
jgi:hypothetical protein